MKISMARGAGGKKEREKGGGREVHSISVRRENRSVCSPFFLLSFFVMCFNVMVG